MRKITSLLLFCFCLFVLSGCSLKGQKGFEETIEKTQAKMEKVKLLECSISLDFGDAKYEIDYYISRSNNKLNEYHFKIKAKENKYAYEIKYKDNAFSKTIDGNEVEGEKVKEFLNLDENENKAFLPNNILQIFYKFFDKNLIKILIFNDNDFEMDFSRIEEIESHFISFLLKNVLVFNGSFKTRGKILSELKFNFEISKNNEIIKREAKLEIKKYK